MAITAPTPLGSVVSGADDSSMSITGVNASAGSTVLVSVNVDRTVGPYTVTDSAGNTYGFDAIADGGSGARCAIFSAHDIQPMSSGSIDISYDSGLYEKRAWAYEEPGLTQVGTLDKAVTLTGNSATWSSGPSGPLAQANELAFCCVARDTTGGSTPTPGSGFVELVDTNLTHFGGHGILYRITTSSASITASGSLPSNEWACCLCTYKGTPREAITGVGMLMGMG